MLPRTLLGSSHGRAQWPSTLRLAVQISPRGAGYQGTLGRINRLGLLVADWQRSKGGENNRDPDSGLKKPLGRENGDLEPHSSFERAMERFSLL